MHRVEIIKARLGIYEGVKFVDDSSVLYHRDPDRAHSVIHPVRRFHVERNKFRHGRASPAIAFYKSLFCLNVVQMDDPEVGTADMAGWFMIRRSQMRILRA